MITTLYAGPLVIFYIALSIRVVMGRYRYRISLGDGGNEDLARRIRTHGNFAEYVPLGLLVLLFAELEGASVFLMHALGVMLLAGRVFHVAAINRPDKIRYARQIGMGLTFTMLLIASVYSFIKSIF